MLSTDIQRKHNFYLKYLKETLSKVARENNKVTLTGGFNLNLKFDTNTEVNDFLYLLTRKCFTPHILGPTTITSQNKPSLIDNIFFNFNDMHCYRGSLIEITDHLPNFFIIEKLTVKRYNQDRPPKKGPQNF